MLEAFWRRGAAPSPRIHEAAHQYGPYAVLCLLGVALELAFMFVITLHRAAVVGSLAAALEALVLVSLWWALVRIRAIKRPTA